MLFRRRSSSFPSWSVICLFSFFHVKRPQKPTKPIEITHDHNHHHGHDILLSTTTMKTWYTREEKDKNNIRDDNEKYANHGAEDLSRWQSSRQSSSWRGRLQLQKESSLSFDSHDFLLLTFQCLPVTVNINHNISIIRDLTTGLF